MKALEGAFSRAFQGGLPDRLGIAVSGGGDSMALLHLGATWARANGVCLLAATVNHGLRAGAADEAKMVAKACEVLGVPHQILHWTDWDRQGNLQDAARRARYRLLADWAKENDIATLALGHTKDDLAETFLMRLARGSGVDGLSAMRAQWQADETQMLRPLLATERRALRAYLEQAGIEWAEDPSNEDLRFDRVKARQALEVLAPLGINIERLALTAQKMSMARKALNRATFDAARALCETKNGDVLVSKTADELPEEVFHRLISHALTWVSSAQYRPRYAALLDAVALVWAGERRSLHGCVLSPEGDKIRISREYQSVKDESSSVNAPWDTRWVISGKGSGHQVRALGDAIKDCPDWRETGTPRMSLMASPSVWNGEVLVAAPLAGMANGWTAKINTKTRDFFTSILSH